METTIQSYLDQKWVFNYKTGREIVAHCVFNECDKDSRWKEAHLYIEDSTWLYHCKKCDSKGNWITLLKHFGDSIDRYPMEWCKMSDKKIKPLFVQKKKALKEENVHRSNTALPQEMREWLNGRWITDEFINKKMLWYGSFFGSNWITIPIRDKKWNPLFFKLRRDPNIEGNRYAYFPNWYGSLYGEEILENPIDEVFICEWEFDKILVEQSGANSITSTSGATTFKDEWIEKLENVEKIYIALDNDETGKRETQKLIEHISLRFPQKEVYKVNIPPEMGKDITDFIMNGWTVEELKNLHSEKVSGVDLAKFTEIGCTDIIEVLSSLIKYDDINKLIVFLGMLSAYTEDSQLNIIMNAQSSSGKSFIPLEISNLFPEDSIVKLHYVSPSAFFHEEARYDDELWKSVVDLDRKILIFIDQQRSDLLERLRPLLSHDQKLLESKIVDKNSSGGNMTKTIFIKWYPSVIFCTTLSKLDEQEATRFILLSPEVHQEKINESINLKIQKESNSKSSNSEEEHIKISNLKERIESVRKAKISKIYITNEKQIKDEFLRNKSYLKPRHQRDIGRYISFIKVFALINFAQRERVGDTLYANDFDREEATKIWRSIEREQEYGVSPYIMKIFNEIFLPILVEKNPINEVLNGKIVGIKRKNILKRYFDKYSSSLADAKWRHEIEPALENAWLIYQEKEGQCIVLFPNDEIIHQYLLSNQQQNGNN